MLSSIVRRSQTICACLTETIYRPNVLASAYSTQFNATAIRRKKGKAKSSDVSYNRIILMPWFVS